MLAYVIPTTATLEAIEQDLRPQLEAQRAVFEILPTRSEDAFYVEWEQRDNYTGLQHLRGLDGPPTRVANVGAKRFLYEPGVYGEFMFLNERDLTVPERMLGSWTTTMDLSAKIAQKHEQLLQRELNRIESVCWTLLSTGTFTVQEGAIIHRDTYDIQTYDGTTWSDLTNATPLADLRAAKLLARGPSVVFGPGSVLWVKQTTPNNLLANRNPNDLGGQISVQITGLQPLTKNLTTVNQFLAGQDLPQIRVYDNFYLDDAGNVQLYIPNGKAILIGQRPGASTLGEYRFVRNANNPNMEPRPYAKVIDHGEDKVPRTIAVSRGHNGGPLIYWGSAVVAVDVS